MKRLLVFALVFGGGLRLLIAEMGDAVAGTPARVTRTA